MPQGLDENMVYRRDAALKVNGVSADGTFVASRAPKYRIEISTKGNLDLLTITTCHREFSAEKLRSGFFGKNRFEYEFIPVEGIEDVGGCPLAIGGYEAEKGRHSWAFVDFETPEATLPARVLCNGTDRQSRGVSICQSREGLLERIAFDVPVEVSPDPGCPLPPSIDKKLFEYPVNKGLCVYAFLARDGRFHRLTTIGYEGIVIRGE